MPDLIVPGNSPKEQPIFYAPADTPPDFNMPDVEWAWRDMPPHEYATRMQRARNMLLALHKLPGVPLGDFQGSRYLHTMSALMTSFKHVKDEFGTLESLLATTTLPRALIEQGTFTDRRKTPATEIAPLLGTDLGGVLLDVKRYELLPEELKDYLGINLLLIAQQRNPFRAAVELQPKDFRRAVDARYLEFYERLASKGIAGVVSMSSAQPFLDSWLGIFDKAAVADRRKPLFPQYGRQPFLDHITLKGTELARPQWRQDYSKEGILRKYRQEDELPKFLDEEKRKGAILKDGQEDQELTTLYRATIGRVGGGWATWWEKFAEDVDTLKPYLNPDQQVLLGLGVMQSVLTHLRTGQLRNLEGLEAVGESLDLGYAMMLPQVASKLRMFYDAFEDKPHALEQLLHSRTGSGHLSSKIYDITTSTDRDFEANLPPEEYLRMRRSRPFSRYADIEDHAPHQETYMEHAIQAVQDNLAGMKVDERLVCELFDYGEIVFTMLGGNYTLYDLNARTSTFIVRFMEYNIGRELPRLREKLASRNEYQATRDAVRALPPYTPTIPPPTKLLQ